MGSVCHRYMCILLYMKLMSVMVLHRSMFIWRRGMGQSAIGICAFFYLLNVFDVVVFQRSMLDWRRGWGQSVIGICAFFYI